ncbi:MAG: hypothetical protein JSU77_10505 [Fidelibacterota bacterium]|nr:MAG: hypothetical protein JSU77_10505 [Candidatus Neomarinimicrobiota bacterium]
MISPTSSRYVIMFLSLTCLASVALAGGQGAAREDSTATPALKAYPWTLQTHVTSLSGPLNLMLKRWFSREVSLRLDININGNIDGSVSALTLGDQPDVTGEEDNTSGSYGISGDVHYIRHLTPDSDFKWYIGAGPHVAYNVSEQRRVSKSEDVNTFNDTFENKRDISNEATFWAAGILVFVGAEWSISDRISLAIENGISGQYKWRRANRIIRHIRTNLDTGDIINDDSYEEVSRSGTWSASFASVKWILAIHF